MKGVGKGNNPNSKAALKHSRFKYEAGAAAAAGRRSGEAKREKKAAKDILENNIGLAIETLASTKSMAAFAALSSNAENQILRIIYREAADKNRAFAALQWLADRVLGKSKQINETTIDGIAVEKPTIVFREDNGTQE